jgi:hypothetical protein
MSRLIKHCGKQGHRDGCESIGLPYEVALLIGLPRLE